ncbi:MAG: YggT family protein, partial [Acidobacteriota bacterium]
MVDNKLELDEARRAAEYEGIKSTVESNVGSEIAARASTPAASQSESVERMADNMRRTAVDEVAETHNEVVRGRTAARVSQVIDYLFFLLYGLLTIRILLELFNARESAGFYRFIQAVTDPFYYPFRGLMRTFSTSDGFSVVLSLVVAVIVYMLLHL